MQKSKRNNYHYKTFGGNDKGKTHELVGGHEDILSSLATQLNTFQAIKNREKAEKALVVFYPKCTKKHTTHECPLRKTMTCNICEQNHKINGAQSYPS